MLCHVILGVLFKALIYMYMYMYMVAALEYRQCLLLVLLLSQRLESLVPVWVCGQGVKEREGGRVIDTAL